MLTAPRSANVVVVGPFQVCFVQKTRNNWGYALRVLQAREGPINSLIENKDLGAVCIAVTPYSYSETCGHYVTSYVASNTSANTVEYPRTRVVTLPPAVVCLILYR